MSKRKEIKDLDVLMKVLEEITGYVCSYNYVQLSHVSFPEYEDRLTKEQLATLPVCCKIQEHNFRMYSTNIVTKIILDNGDTQASLILGSFIDTSDISKFIPDDKIYLIMEAISLITHTSSGYKNSSLDGDKMKYFGAFNELNTLEYICEKYPIVNKILIDGVSEV